MCVCVWGVGGWNVNAWELWKGNGGGNVTSTNHKKLALQLISERLDVDNPWKENPNQTSKKVRTYIIIPIYLNEDKVFLIANPLCFYFIYFLN